jgi:homocysteine S-methyltransferase
MTITLLDGGIGQELVARAGDRPTPLWSTRAMMDHPGLLQGVHADYFAAGADIATTNTYAIHRDRLTPDGLEHLFEPLHAAAMAEAQAARAAHGRGRIAGSIGPLAATYRPELHPDAATAVPLYAEMVRMVAPGADLILFESVASLAHAETALAGADAVASGLPVWLSATLDDEDGTRLRSGEAVSDLLPILEAGGAAAVLANCSAPEAMSPALEVFARSGLPFGAYANGFTQITKAFLENRPTTDTLEARRDMGPEIYADHVMRWAGQGATIVGGCCETGPAHIAEIARRLREAGMHD